MVLVGLLAGPVAAQQRQNAVTWGFASEIETMDPYATGKRTAQLVIRNVLEHLVLRDAKGDLKPALATAWKWVDDKTLEFTLRRGVAFHDGQPFDADDVVFTVQHVKRTDIPIAFGATDYGFINRAEKIDPYTVRLLLNAPTPSAVDRLSQTLFILPKSANMATFGPKPNGTGPYKVSVFEAGRRVELAKNDAYYAADWGRPRLDRINVVTIPDAQTQVAELTSGRVDFLWNISVDQMQSLARATGVTTVPGGSTSISFLIMDAAGRAGQGPMQNKTVRQAIAHAINREAISKVLRGGSSVVIDAPCHPKQFGCIQDVAVKYEYNVAKAKALLASTPYAAGFDLPISAFTDGGPVAEAVIGDLREIGIRGKLDFKETSAWVKDLWAGKLPATVSPWPSNGVYDASAMVPLFFMGEQGDYARDEEVMAWFKQAGSITEPAERLRLYRLGFEKIAREAYVVPLMTNVTNFAYRSNLDFTMPSDGYPLAYMLGWK